MNGTTTRKFKVPLSFLGAGQYQASLVHDNSDGTAAQTELPSALGSGSSLTIDLQAGGGFLARLAR